MSVGDAARYLEGFAAEMASVGNSPLTISGYLDSVIHFAGWLEVVRSRASVSDRKPTSPHQHDIDLTTARSGHYLLAQFAFHGTGTHFFDLNCDDDDSS